MKKLGIITMVCALLLSLSQCKKNEQTTTDNQDDTVTITLNVKALSTGSETDDAKVDVNTATGCVDYEIGDQVHVASSGKYVGTLTYNGTLFVGTISNATEGLPLQFYFLGNVQPSEALTLGVTESCSVVISDQTEHLPVVSTAPSVEEYTASLSDYTATLLLNKCALVKFNVTTSSEVATCITGFNNKVTVDFSTNTFAYSQENDGVITLPAGSGERWAILLPQSAMESGALGSAYSADEAYTGTRGAVPAISDNGYLFFGIPVNVTTSAGQSGVIPGGFTNALFSVSATQQVCFSQGNLQYIGSAGNGDANNTGAYWKFADHQWDRFGTTTGQNSSNKKVDRDLFGWGTSGYNHGATAYQPWSTSTTYSHYYAYGKVANDLFSQTGKADWGYNAISNGGNQENSGWRTLTKDEWGYLFDTRSASTVNGTANARYAKAKVNGVKGYILFPDVYIHPAGVALPIYINDQYSDYSSNYTVEDFTQMEAHGTVFLPVAGYRNGTSILNLEYVGYYWTSTHHASNTAGIVDFTIGNFHPQVNGYRYNGCSVRLVRNAQ